MFLLPVRSLTIASFGLAGLIYGVRGELALGRRYASPAAARQLGVCIAFAFLTVAVRLWFLTTSDLLYSTTGPLTGASYSDVHVLLSAINVRMAAALGVAINIAAASLRAPLVSSTLVAVGSYFILAFVVREVIPAAYPKLFVAPNELCYEKVYL